MLKINEILKATEGRLICGHSNLEVGGISIDSRDIKKGDLFIAIKGDKFDGHDFIDEAVSLGASAIIIDSRQPVAAGALKVATIKVKDTVKALGDIASYWRSCFDIPVVCVTGSNGKTTTKDMIAWLLEADFKVLKNEGTKNNNIGVPLTLLKLNKEHQCAVIEIGTNHFGEIKRLAQIASPNIGVITNIGHSHLEFLKTLKGVYQEKTELLKNLDCPRIAILNSDDKFLKAELKKKGILGIGFGIKDNADFKASAVKRKGSEVNFHVNNKWICKLNTFGQHNIYNALASIAVARIFGLDYGIILKRLSGFEFPSGRLRFVKSQDVNFIDDSYNSNPLSLDEALDTLAAVENEGRKILVMGDMLELGDEAEVLHRKVSHKINETCDILITVGDLTQFTVEELKNNKRGRKIIYTCSDSLQARRILFNVLIPTDKDVVLLKGSRRMKLEEILKK